MVAIFFWSWRKAQNSTHGSIWKERHVPAEVPSPKKFPPHPFFYFFFLSWAFPQPVKEKPFLSLSLFFTLFTLSNLFLSQSLVSLQHSTFPLISRKLPISPFILIFFYHYIKLENRIISTSQWISTIWRAQSATSRCMTWKLLSEKRRMVCCPLFLFSSPLPMTKPGRVGNMYSKPQGNKRYYIYHYPFNWDNLEIWCS